MEAFGGLAGVGVLLAGIGFGWAQFRSGANKAKDDLINTLKEALEVEKEKVIALVEEKNTLVKSHQEQINLMNKEIGKLQGLQESNERKIKEYTEILQGRNPDSKSFMKQMSDGMKQTSLVLREISTELKEHREEFNAHL